MPSQLEDGMVDGVKAMPAITSINETQGWLWTQLQIPLDSLNSRLDIEVPNDRFYSRARRPQPEGRVEVKYFAHF